MKTIAAAMSTPEIVCGSASLLSLTTVELTEFFCDISSGVRTCEAMVNSNPRTGLNRKLSKNPEVYPNLRSSANLPTKCEMMPLKIRTTSKNSIVNMV